VCCSIFRYQKWRERERERYIHLGGQSKAHNAPELVPLIVYIKVKGDAEEKENKRKLTMRDWNEERAKRHAHPSRKNATIKRSSISSSPPVHQQI
jgi:hypothetical protein